MKNNHLFAASAFNKLLEIEGVTTVLDVGSGAGHHAEVMRRAGKEVTTISLLPPADFVGNYLDWNRRGALDAIWASHVLEHQLNVNRFLRKCFYDLAPEGILAITVPPAKHAVVGGHINLFNPGTLLYNLILAGFDCSKAMVSPCYMAGCAFPYNLSVIVKQKQADLPEDLHMDNGDIEKLAKFFPCPVYQGFDGQMVDGVNWGSV